MEILLQQMVPLFALNLGVAPAVRTPSGPVSKPPRCHDA